MVDCYVDLKELDESIAENVFGEFEVKVSAINDNNKSSNFDSNDKNYNKSASINVSKIIFDANEGKFENDEETFIAFLETGKKLDTINQTGFSSPTKFHNNFDDWYINDQKLIFNEFTINEPQVTILAQWNSIDHNFEFDRYAKEATCTETGEEIKKCTMCGLEKSEAVAALGHNYIQESTDTQYKITDATCQAKATYYKSCVRCGLASTTETFESGNKAAHSYTSTSSTAYKATDATCQAAATYYKTCVWCGAKGTATFSSGNTAAHSYTSTSSTAYKATDATCQAAATYYKTCVWCGAKGTATFSSGNTAAHSYTSTSSTAYKATDATCQKKATYYKTCVWCGAKGTTTFSSGSTVAHSYTANCSTCGGTGYTERYNSNWYYCSTGNHCIVVNHCDTHNKKSLPGGYTGIKVCSKCGTLTSLYRRLSDKGTGKQCKWCGTGKK